MTFVFCLFVGWSWFSFAFSFPVFHDACSSSHSVFRRPFVTSLHATAKGFGRSKSQKHEPEQVKALIQEENILEAAAAGEALTQGEQRGKVTVVVPEPSVAYEGPIPVGGSVAGLVGTIDIEPYGLIMEIGESVVAPGELGCFLRLREDASSATLPAATVLCGYAAGTWSNVVPSSPELRSVRFDLQQDDDEEAGKNDATVLFDGLICRVADLMDCTTDKKIFHGLSALAGVIRVEGRGGLSGLNSTSRSTSARHVLTPHDLVKASRILGHDVTFSKEEKNRRVTITVSSNQGPLYFVPNSRTGAGDMDADVSTLLTAGQYLNDLAVDIGNDDTAFVVPSEAEYEAASKTRNIAVLHWRLEAVHDGEVSNNEDENTKSSSSSSSVAAHTAARELTCLVPSNPVIALERSVNFQNHKPMEIGCRYGCGFWQEWKGKK